jgi:hypothetical protein
MNRAFKIPPLLLCGAVMFLGVGEIAAGTDILFVALMMLTTFCIGMAYNQLGGVSTFSGILFTVFALRTIVISQVAKVLLFEPAHKHLQNPILTISVYALFYVCAFIGIFLFAGFRVKLPKPAEPETQKHYGLLYAFALCGGVFGTVLYELNGGGYGEQGKTIYNAWHSAGIALSPLLLFSVVLAIDMRLRRSNGRHSVDLLVIVPWVIETFVGFGDTVRVTMLSATVVYFATCVFRGYRFRKRHYAAGAIGALGFIFLLSPIAVYARNFTEGLTWSGRIYQSTSVISEVIHNPDMLLNIEGKLTEKGNPNFSNYFTGSGVSILNRFSLIGPDSTVVYACAGGLHYGLAAVIIDFKIAIPSFLYKDKPREESGQDYIGRISGMSGDSPGVTFPAISLVSDSYGAFGWLGVIVVPLVLVPALFVQVESMYDISRPWGIVAFGLYFLPFGEMMLGRFFSLMVRTPLYLLAFSYVLSFLIRTVPTRGERILRVMTKPGTAAVVGTN